MNKETITVGTASAERGKSAYGMLRVSELNTAHRSRCRLR